MGYATKHFIERCHQRAPGVDAEALARDLVSAIRSRSADVDHVLEVKANLSIYRCAVKDGRRFYALCDVKHGTAVTLLSQEMVADYKAVRRGKARNVREVIKRREILSYREAGGARA